MLLLLDNYDSFTWNLFHYLEELGVDVLVRRNDAITVEEALDARIRAIVISPGPGRPENAGITPALVRAAAERRRPLLGVCLGHQAIGHVFGARIVRAGRVMHGKTSPVRHDGGSVFAGLPSPFVATRYHSLVIARAGLPAELVVTAESEDDGEIMGIAHRHLPLHGVQFHPESIASEQGHQLLANFLRLAGLEPRLPADRSLLGAAS
ncbi:MAG: aminodeoxychorismate/anthranilate synthase component II [Alphaproteobacteria bacterium]|nr:MAG: aminodeoxychorismate/anthranilate synthase component II [Alphaproteobacteria bacterium]